MLAPAKYFQGGNPVRTAWLVVLASYLVIYGAFLLHTGGFPYTIDNNESFSSLVHARNLADFDLGRSFGLTDESYALTEAGHPYIHSHQGNFPRIFAFLIYLLGAKSIESQIWITTFTIGLVAIWLAFRFASRLGGPWVGALACLILMTDYVLFAQWQVNTYRVWHAFFFFSSLECVHLATARRRWLGWVVAVANFAALFYWEYVFGAFIGLMAALYTLLVHRRAWRALLLAWSGIAGGGLVAASTLLAQLTAYMGWGNVLRDIRYTLLARNSASNHALAAEINAFYDRHNILFWQNYVDASPLKSWRVAWEGFLDFHWRYSSPVLVALTLVVLAAWLIARLPGLGRLRTRDASTGSPRLALLGRFVLLGLAGPSIWQLVNLLASGPADTPPSRLLPFAFSLLLPPACALVWFGNLSGLRRLSWRRLLAALGFFHTALALLQSWPALDRSGGNAELLHAIEPFQSRGLAFFMIAVSVLLALSLMAIGSAQVLGRGPARLILRLAGVVAVVLGAFAPVYFIFAGYVYSGYLHRQAPFLVFASDLLLAAAAAALAGAAWRAVRRNRRPVLQSLPARRPWMRAATGPALVVAALLVASGWISLQAALWRAAPPTNYRFLSQLRESPYRHASFAVSTYAAPVSVMTGSWAYFESTLFSGSVSLGPAGWSMPHDHQYLWFADRATNSAYGRPDFALHIVQPASVSVALDAAADATARPAEASALFRRARTPFQPFLQHRVAASDGSHFSLLRLDWDYPPYLKPHEAWISELARQLTLRQKLALSNSGETNRRWRVELELLDPAAAGAGIELIADGKPVDLPAFSSTGPLVTVLHADRLRLRIRRPAHGGRLRVTVNESTETVDLAALASPDVTFDWSSAQPHGKYTILPRFVAGFYLQTGMVHRAGQLAAELRYRYVHQDGTAEAATTVRLYAEGNPGSWRQVDSIVFLGNRGVPVRLADFRRANADTIAEHEHATSRGDPRTYEQWLADHLTAHPEEWTRPGIVTEALPSLLTAPSGSGEEVVRVVPLANAPAGRLQFSVSPGTRTKQGPEYFGLSFLRTASAKALTGALAVTDADSTQDLPFGRLHLKLRFPDNRWPQAEPILTTGSNEAGDIVYVIYADPGHIRIGFDHWFKGGPLSAPIPIDLAREHELEISIGSLFPASEDIVFLGRPAGEVASVKNRVVIKLDGTTVIDSEGTCYESHPSQVVLGRNLIKGTSAGPEFTGEVISATRTWPWPEEKPHNP